MDMHVRSNSLSDINQEIAIMLSQERSRRILAECLALNQESDRALGLRSMVQCRELDLDPIHVLNSSEQYKAICDASRYFIDHPHMLANSEYTWDDHCRKYPVLKSLTDPDSPEGWERRQKLAVLDCTQFIDLCYARMRRLVSNPEAI